MKTSTSVSQADDPASRKRLPRLTRAAGDTLPGFRLTERDTAIIEAVYAYRALTATQIEQLFFSPSTRTQRNLRLKLLYHHGFLLRTEQPQSLTEGRKPFVYWLDKKGAELLAINREIEVSEIDWHPRTHLVGSLFLAHLLATNDVRIAISLAADKQGFVLDAWQDDKTLRKEHVGETVTIKGAQGGLEQVSVVPDGYGELDTGDHLYRFFIEVDRRTVTGASEKSGSHDWARKIRAYIAYYNSDKIAAKYGSRGGRVLTVTTGEKRAANLKVITEREGGKGRFWFTTFAQATAERILTQPIWTVAGKEGLYTLV